MGMNTVVQILNDAWGEIEADPKRFVEIIDNKMNGDHPEHADGHINVMNPHHSSEYKSYVSGGNTITEVSPREVESLLERGLYEYVETLINSLQTTLKSAKRARKEYMEKNEPLLLKAQNAVDFRKTK